MSNFAWVTLTTNDTYSLGALVLAHSLRRAGTTHQLAVLVTPGVSESMRGKLQDVYNVVQEVNVLDSQDAANLALLARPELGITFTKLHCWRLVQFEKCVFLDSDTLVLQNCDELFEREELSAAPDVSWPDCFNSGVFVFKPSLDTFTKITEFALQNGSFDGGDQGLLNSYFADWAHKDITKHLPFVYNVTAYASYCYLPAFKQFRDKIKILHFAGKMKPWLIQFNSESRTACAPSDYAHASDLIQLWWNIFCDNVHQKLTDNMIYWPSYTITDWSFREPNYHDTTDHISVDPNSLPIIEQLPQPCNFFDYDNIKEFHDPWEDYYENLERRHDEPNLYHDVVYEQVIDVHIDNSAHEVEDRARPCTDSEATTHFECPRIATFESSELSYKENDEDNHNEGAQIQAAQQSMEAFIDEYLAEAFSPPLSIEATDTVSLPVFESSCYPTEAKDAQELEEFNDNAFTVQNTQNTQTVSSADHAEQEIANEAGLAGALSQLRLGEHRTPEQEAYEQLMRRQCWESGQVDYAGKDSFDNIWKKITQTLDEKPTTTTTETTPKPEEKSEILTSADIEDGKIEFDRKTNASTQYKLIEGGYEMIITTPQPNGTVKTQVKTFWDPKPVSDDDLVKEAANKKLIKSRLGKEVRIDKHTTMLTREIAGGYEEVYTTVNDDGSRSMRTKTFFDSVPQELPADANPNSKALVNKPKKAITRISSVDSTDSTESRRVTQRKNLVQTSNDKQSKYQEESTVEESRRVTQSSEVTENNRTVRKNSVQEQNIKSITQASGTSDNKDSKKKKKTKGAIPPPPADFISNDSTTVAAKRVPGGTEYTYSTQLESGKTITTTKTVYAEEEVEMTEEEIRLYKKTLKDAEKHKNVTSTKKLKSESGTKKIVPSENPGDVTTVETIKIEGGTEYHYTTVTAEGIVKKAVKTIYDPVPSNNPDESEEEEIIEDYEEEIIEPGEKSVRTIETVKQLPQKFEEEITITHEKKEKKVKKSMMISH